MDRLDTVFRIWIAMTFFVQVYALTPVTMVEFGDRVSIECVFSTKEHQANHVHWYKQTVGDVPHIMVTMQTVAMKTPEFHPGFQHSNFEVTLAKGVFRLTFLRVAYEDEAMYHCAVSDWYRLNFKAATYLSLRGTSQKMNDYQRVVQQSESEPVHPGDSVTLQCSVLSQTCTGQHSVFWFRAGSGESHPGLIYTQGNRSGQCEKRPETPSPTQSCLCSLSLNNLSFSDTGTYYCAVATCGEILFGNGTIVEVAPDKTVDPLVILLGVTSLCLAFSVIFNFILIYTRNPRSSCEQCNVSPSRELAHDASTRIEASSGDGGADTLNYAALHFSERKLKRGRKKKETTPESVYSGVRYSDRE